MRSRVTQTIRMFAEIMWTRKHRANKIINSTEELFSAARCASKSKPSYPQVRTVCKKVDSMYPRSADIMTYDVLYFNNTILYFL